MNRNHILEVKKKTQDRVKSMKYAIVTEFKRDYRNIEKIFKRHWSILLKDNILSKEERNYLII